MWKVLCNAPSNVRTQNNLEASFIGIMKPLNEQLDSAILTLLRNGVYMK